jgi:hypothetical protein
MNKAVFALILVLAACGGDDSPQATPDATPGPPCTKATYDVCAENTDCNSQNCHLFNGEFTVCTQACDANNPCPVDATGVAGTCNQKGICKPHAANNCTLP